MSSLLAFCYGQWPPVVFPLLPLILALSSLSSAAHPSQGMPDQGASTCCLPHPSRKGGGATGACSCAHSASKALAEEEPGWTSFVLLFLCPLSKELLRVAHKWKHLQSVSRVPPWPRSASTSGPPGQTSAGCSLPFCGTSWALETVQRPPSIPDRSGVAAEGPSQPLVQWEMGGGLGPEEKPQGEGLWELGALAWERK